MSSSGWCTIESDPGVFSSLIKSWGAKDVQVEEIFSLDDEVVSELGRVHGLIFLFKWDGKKDTREAEDVYGGHSDVFFASQVIQNACATQALISILLNLPADVEIGEMLRNFREFTAAFPPELKGEALQDQAEIRTSHNSFARPEPFVVEEQKATGDEDVYHFISYLPIGGVVYELDGLKKGPIRLGPVPDDGNWFSVARTEVQRRMEAYSSAELGFTLLALVKNRRVQAEEKLAEVTAEVATVTAQLAAADGDAEAALRAQLEGLEAQARLCRDTIETETHKFKRWEIENQRRKHNYVPFIVELFSALAETDKLGELREGARKRGQDLAAAAKKRKEEAKEST